MEKTFAKFCVIGFLLLPIMLFSQVEITVGPSFPVGPYLNEVKTFTSDNNELKLPDGNYLYGAKIGLDVGLKYRLKIHQGWSAFLGANMIWNPVKKDFKTKIEDEMSALTEKYEVHTGQYFQIPIMLGLNYTYNPSNEFGIFVEAGAGVNLLQRSPFQVTTTLENTFINKSYDTEIKSKYDMSCTFGFQAGIGAVVKNRYLISVHYYGLGSAPAKGSTTISGYDAIVNDAINNLETQIPFLTNYLGNMNTNIDGTTKFNSDKRMFSQVISFTFGVRFGECNKDKKVEKATVQKDENTKVNKPEKSSKSKKTVKPEKTKKNI